MENDTLEFLGEDVAGDASTTASFEVGQTVTSEILGDGDSDAFAITIEAGQTINFSQLNDTNFSREVILTDSDGNSVAQGADSFRFFTISNDDFVFQAEETGTYFLTITGIIGVTDLTQSFGEGIYSLTATEIEDDFGNFTSSATQLDIGTNEINGNLEYLGDIDAFTVNLAAGDAISLSLSDEVVSEISLVGPDGNLIGLSQSDIEFTAITDGEYTVFIEASFDVNRDFRGPFPSTGEYTLTANIASSSDAIIGTNDGDVIAGTDGSDEIIGLAGNDMLSGFGGNDVLNGGSGEDQLLGGDGQDTLIGEDGPDFLFGEDGADLLLGGFGSDTLFGGAGNDRIEGGPSEDNFITGGVFGGNDFLIGGSEADTFALLDVGAGVTSHDTIADFEVGVDRLDVRNLDGINAFEDLNIVTNSNGNVAIFISATNSVTFANLSDPSALDVSSFFFDGPSGSNGITIEGSSGVDNIDGTAGNDDISGLGGDDNLDGFEGNDTLNGGDGDDLIAGGDGNDLILGGAGDDFISGGLGANSLFGEDGDDTLTAFSGNDFLDGGNGNDNLNGGSGDDVIIGGAGDDFINGSSGADRLFGGDGDDRFLLPSGNEVIDGGAGNDRFITGGRNVNGNGVLTGGTGADTFVLLNVTAGNSSHDVITDFELGVDILDVSSLRNVSSIEDLFITTNDNGNVAIFISETNSITFTNLFDPSDLDASNFFFEGQEDVTPVVPPEEEPIDPPSDGGSDDDAITGTAGNDRLDGTDGADVLAAGDGNDFLVGGNGADRFVFTDVAAGNRSYDVISDFQVGTDLIDLSGISGVSSFEDLFITNNGEGQVAIYLSSDQSIAFDNLTDVNALSANDFVFDGQPPALINTITGSSGNDRLDGTEGADVLDGGAGNDFLVGSTGGDTFVFTNNTGFNRVADFGNGDDVIDLSATDFESFADVNLVEQNGTVFIFINANSSVELSGVETVEELSAEDFIF